MIGLWLGWPAPGLCGHQGGLASPERECKHRLHPLTALACRYVIDDYIAMEEMMTATGRQNWFEGWRLFALLTLILMALCVWVAGMWQFEVEGVRMVIRFTARSSLLFFCLAFSSAALARLWPNGWTRWQRRNRRYLGVTFAASHALHAV